MQKNEKILPATRACSALAEAIRDLGNVPDGVLYAHVMGHVTLESYRGLIEVLVNAGVVRRDGNLLVWVGDEIYGSKKPTEQATGNLILQD